MTDFFQRLAEKTMGMAQVAKPLIPSMFDRDPVPTFSTQIFNDADASQEDISDSTQFVEDRQPQLVMKPTSEPYQLYDDSLPEKKKSKVVNGKQPVTGSNDRESVEQFKVRMSLPKNRKDNDSFPESKIHEIKSEHESFPDIMKEEIQDNVSSDADDTENNMKKIDEDTQIPYIISVKRERLPDPLMKKKHLDQIENPLKILVQKKIFRPHISIYQGHPEHLLSKQDINPHKSTSTEPIVRVTIGRIDVRAVMQQPQPLRRLAPITPKLSLEDYLKSRNGGQR